jgi:hypothetical protein
MCSDLLTACVLLERAIEDHLSERQRLKTVGSIPDPQPRTFRCVFNNLQRVVTFDIELRRHSRRSVGTPAPLHCQLE